MSFRFVLVFLFWLVVFACVVLVFVFAFLCLLCSLFCYFLF